MLRIRSGESQAEKPPAVDETALAELGVVVADAQAEIKRLMQLGELQNDPIRHPIQALSVHLDALYNVTRAGSLLVAKQLAASAPGADPAAVRDEDLRRAVVQGIAAYSREAGPTLSLRSVVVGAVLLLVALLAGARAGYWFGQSAEAARFVQVPAGLGVAMTGPDAAQWVDLMRLNDIGKAERVCGSRSGGVACTISLWVKPPTAKVDQAAR